MAQPSEDPNYQPGDVVQEKYQLVQLLAVGGMGSVWQAHNLTLDSAIALKLIRNLRGQSQATDRFVQEARVAAKLAHPSIVRVFDLGTTERGEPFIAMELLQGKNLGELINELGRLAALEAVRVVLPAMDALVLAHARGVVHRDLKPDNIFLAEEGDRVIPKLVDFGVAKLEQPHGESQRITRAGAILGSPAYMSPQQARGDEHIDARTDVWGMAVVLYETLTGQVPFGDDDNYNAVLRRIIEDEPRPITELAAGDPDLWRVLARGLDKDPGERWQSMEEFGAALARWALARGAQSDVTGQALSSTWLERVSGGDAPLSRLSMSSLPDADEITGEAPVPVRRSSAPPETLATEPPPASSKTLSGGATLPLPSTHSIHPPEQRAGRIRLALGAGLLLVLGVAGGLALSGGDDSGSAAAAPAIPPPRTTPPEAAEAPEVKAQVAAPASASAEPAPAAEAAPSKPPARPKQPSARPAPIAKPKPISKPAKPKLGDDFGF